MRLRSPRTRRAFTRPNEAETGYADALRRRAAMPSTVLLVELAADTPLEAAIEEFVLRLRL
jgi:hypothetical protein